MARLQVGIQPLVDIILTAHSVDTSLVGKLAAASIVIIENAGAMGLGPTMPHHKVRFGKQKTSGIALIHSS
jgi:hypothetical protein